MRRLNVLSSDIDQVEIATPCTVPWDSLVGDDVVRHCGHCRQSVYNLQGLHRAEVSRLMDARRGRRDRLCLRVFRRADGTVVTADCWSRLRIARGQGLVALLVMLVVVGWAELVAIGVGISSLRRLTAGPPPPRKVFIPVHVKAREPDLMAGEWVPPEERDEKRRSVPDDPGDSFDDLAQRYGLKRR